MALSCYHYDSLLCKCFPMQKSYLKMLKTALLFLHSHLKTTVKLHITVFSEVSEYKTLNMYFTLLHMLFTILICSQHCEK